VHDSSSGEEEAKRSADFVSGSRRREPNADKRVPSRERCTRTKIEVRTEAYEQKAWPSTFHRKQIINKLGSRNKVTHGSTARRNSQRTFDVSSRCIHQGQGQGEGSRPAGASARAPPPASYTPGVCASPHVGSVSGCMRIGHPECIHASRIIRARSAPFSCIQAPVPRPSGHVPSPFGGRGVRANALLLDERVEQHAANANGASEQLNGLQRLA